ncbi:hypothetical protein V1460_05230 [Streptomyces sp. SCSIO 30461]|uniref:hypothetical protein n=1 Tax=Streptomyces sp. SCSIO 30461 TaxID=3118085 RepID=UPI0030D1E31A
MGAVARRLVAVVAALVLFLEAVGIVVINGIMATFVGKQNMSLDGMDPDHMVTATWVMGGVFGLFLAACGVLLLIAGIRDRAPGRFGRVLLIVCAVMHGVIGAVTVGLLGWHAFAFMMAVLGLIVLALVVYGAGAPGAPDEPADHAPTGTPEGPATAPGDAAPA